MLKLHQQTVEKMEKRITKSEWTIESMAHKLAKSEEKAETMERRLEQSEKESRMAHGSRADTHMGESAVSKRH